VYRSVDLFEKKYDSISKKNICLEDENCRISIIEKSRGKLQKKVYNEILRIVHANILSTNNIYKYHSWEIYLIYKKSKYSLI
jgi:hypothetical protein